MSAATVIVRLRYSDWDKAKAFIDSSNAQRKRFTGTRHTLARDLSNPQVLVAVVQFDDLERAQAWVETSIDPVVVKDVDENAGLREPPEIWIGEDVEDLSY